MHICTFFAFFCKKGIKITKKSVAKATDFRLFSQFATILGAQFVGALRTAQSHVGLLPKAFGIQQDAQFPQAPPHDGQCQQGQSIDAADEQHRGEHHQVIPVKNAAGGATASAHHQAEGTPNQHANQIADIECHADEE